MSRTLRIGLVSHEYPPFVGGGIGSYVLAAAKELARAGHRVHVFANSALSSQADDTGVPGLTVHRLPLFTDSYQRPPEQPAYLGLDPAAFRYASREAAAHAENLSAWTIAQAVRAVHGESGLDVVEVPDCMAEAFYLVRRRLAGEDLPPVVVHLHGNTLESYGSADDPITLGYICVRARLRREDLTIQHADAVLCPSQSGIQRYAKAYGASLPAKRAVIPYYFEPAVPAEAPPELGSWPFLVMVGRVEPRKGTDYAVEAFAKVANEHPELRLVLCGAGDTWLRGESVDAMLRARLPERLLGRVVRLGRQPRAVVLAVLARATLMVHPARWDNWPNAVLEAMSVGCCCVVSDAGGQAEMIESGRSGLVVPLGDVDGLAESMRSMLRDEALRRRFGAAARERMAELCAAGTVTAQKVAAYEQAMRGGRAAAAVGEPFTRGLLVIDAAGAPELHGEATRAAVGSRFSAADGWRRCWLTDSGAVQVGFEGLAARGHDAPWLGLPDDAVMVWCRAGAVPDAAALQELQAVLSAAADVAATFLWLAPEQTGEDFPHRCDLGWRDLLFEGATLPPVFAVRVRDLRATTRRTGLATPAARIAALLGTVTARRAGLAVHIARLGGTCLGALPVLDRDAAQRGLGFLDLQGLLPRSLIRLGCDGSHVDDEDLGQVPRPRSRWSLLARGVDRVRRLLFPSAGKARTVRHSKSTPPADRPLRVCLAGHEYPPYPGGGIATYGRNAAKALSEAGHEVHVVTNTATFGSADPAVDARVHREGRLTVHRFDLLDEQYRSPPGATFYGLPPEVLRHPRSIWARDVATLTALRLAEAVAKLHEELRFDVVEVPDMFAEGFFLARRRIAGGRASLPPICVLGHTSSRETYRAAHDAWQLGGAEQRHRLRLEDACITEADALVTPSRSLLERYEEYFGAALPAVRAAIPNFYEPPKAPLPGASDLPAELAAPGPLLLVIGRVEPRKGSDTALAAFAQLRNEFPDLRLAFIGGDKHWWPGETFVALRDALVPPADRVRVLLPGLLSYEQVFAAARRATVVLHPARWDNWPNAVLEAMSVGACCVVSDHGGQGEMVEHGRSGMVFPAEDATALANVLRGLLRDPVRRAALGAAAVTRAAALCDPRTILAAKIAIYRAAAARAQGSSAPPAVVVVDADGIDAAAVAATVGAVDATWSGKGVRRFLLAHGTTPLPPGWRTWPRLDPLPWAGAPADAVVVWLRGGAVPDAAGCAALLQLARDGGGAAAAALWLAPRNGRCCHPSDLSQDDVVLIGAGLPSVLASEARHLAACHSLLGASNPAMRVATLVAMAAIASGRSVRHTGDVGGTDLERPLILDDQGQTALLGRLTVERLLDRAAVVFGE